MIVYRDTAENVEASQLTGFFVGWPHPPAPATHLRLLRQSDAVVLAWDDESRRVVGFVTALTDGVLSAYIPLLEVLPPFQRRGIGRELVRRVLARLGDCYMIDAVCDRELLPFYSAVGFAPSAAVSRRDYARQSGA